LAWRILSGVLLFCFFFQPRLLVGNLRGLRLGIGRLGAWFLSATSADTGQYSPRSRSGLETAKPSGILTDRDPPQPIHVKNSALGGHRTLFHGTTIGRANLIKAYLADHLDFQYCRAKVR